MKIASTLIATACVFAAISAHATVVDKAKKCPSITSIRQVGIQHIDKSKVGEDWIGWSNNKYATKESWLFAVINI